MNVRFNWNPAPTREQKEAVETEICEALLHGVVKPCHSGDISVFLRINGALNTVLKGVAKCQCGKSLMSFYGDDHGSTLYFDTDQQARGDSMNATE